MAELTAPSDFQSARAWSAHWRARASSGVFKQCATQGRTFSEHVQRLISSGLTPGEHIVFGDVSIHPEEVVPDAEFGPKSVAGAAAYITQLGGPRTLVQALRDEYSAQVRAHPSGPGDELGGQTMRALEWIALESPSSPDSAIGSDVPARGLRWNVAPPADGANAGRILCWDPATEPIPAARGSTSTPATTPTGTTPVRTPTGEGRVTEGTSGGAGGAGIQPGGGWSTWSTGTKVGIVAAGAGAAALVAVAVALAMKKKKG